MTTNWKELFKVNIANPDKSFSKHEVIKLLLVMHLLRKHRKIKHRIRIYTEFSITSKRKADVYFENYQTKESIVYEIQKEFNSNWLDKLKQDYKTTSIPFMNTFDVIPLKLNDFPDDIDGINKRLEELI